MRIIIHTDQGTTVTTGNNNPGGIVHGSLGNIRCTDMGCMSRNNTDCSNLGAACNGNKHCRQLGAGCNVNERCTNLGAGCSGNTNCSDLGMGCGGNTNCSNLGMGCGNNQNCINLPPGSSNLVDVDGTQPGMVGGLNDSPTSLSGSIQQLRQQIQRPPQRRQPQRRRQIQQVQPPPFEQFKMIGDQAIAIAQEGKDRCVVCLTNINTHTFIPCGHKSVCATCAKQIGESTTQKCPVCREDVSSAMRTYWWCRWGWWCRITHWRACSLVRASNLNRQ